MISASQKFRLSPTANILIFTEEWQDDFTLEKKKKMETCFKQEWFFTNLESVLLCCGTAYGVDFSLSDGPH